MLAITFPAGTRPPTKQPDGSYSPTNRPHPNVNPQITFQPGTTRHWPTVVLEVSRSHESLRDLKERCNVYLGPGSQINVWVGIKCFFNGPPGQPQTITSWWMGVYCRDPLVPGQPQPVNPGPPRCLGELPDTTPHETIHTVRNEVFSIPTWLLFHPTNPPAPPPPPPPPNPAYRPLPQNWTLNAEWFRQLIVRFA